MKRIFDSLVSPSGGTRFPALDGLRGMACFAVATSHIFALYKPFYWFAAYLGGSAVCIFFALSAFLLFYPWAKGKPIELRPYFIRRFFRIYPAYLVMIGFAWLVSAIIKKPLTYQNIISSLFFVHSFKRAWISPLVGQTWSLPAEVHFYIFLPILAFIAIRYRKSFFSLAIPTGIFLSLAITLIPSLSKGSIFADHNLPFLILPFIVGMLVAWLTVNNSFVPRGVIFVALIGFIASWLIPAFIMPKYNSIRMLFHPQGIVLSFWVGTIILALALSRDTLIHKFLAWHPIRSMGIIGYSIFLIHLPLYAMLTHFGGIKFCALLGLPITLLLAALSYLYIESPFIRFAANRLSRSAQSQLPPVAAPVQPFS